MKVIIKRVIHDNQNLNGTPFGVELIAETDEDHHIIRRFWDSGIKQNVLSNTDERLQLTFKDLIGKPFPETTFSAIENDKVRCANCGEVVLIKCETEKPFSAIERSEKLQGRHILYSSGSL